MLLRYVSASAYELLPPKLASFEASLLLYAIGWQESRFEHRTQLGGGPARGFWQFEMNGGVKGVLEHKATKTPIRDAMLALKYPPNMNETTCWHAIEHNDVLAFCFARLLLFASPLQIPHEQEAGWRIYLANWRPGKPHPTTWSAAWKWATAHIDTFQKGNPDGV